MFEKVIEDLQALKAALDGQIQRTKKLEEDFAGLTHPRVTVGFGGFVKPKGMLEPAPMKNFEGESAAIVGLSLADAVAILIKGAPATTREILNLLKSHGRFVGGKKPLVTLYSSLTRSKVIRRLPNKKWGSLL